MGLRDRLRRDRAALPEAEVGRAFAQAMGVPAATLAKAVRRGPDGQTITDLSQLASMIQGDTGAMGAPFAAGTEPGGDAFSAAGMGPGWPAQPFPLGGEPRQWQYRPGFNFPSPPDVDRGIDASLLRCLADQYDLLRQCIEVCKNEIAALDWDVVPREKNRRKREVILAEQTEEIDRIKQFFEWPEAYITQDAAGHWVRRGRTPWQQWIKAQLEDFYVGDWLTIWPRFMRNGDLLAFERVDGSTIKPLVDTEGRQPPPPLPAWQQYLYGVPRASFTLDELLYRPYTPRNFTVYGYSHVEQMLMLINLALRFQMWNQQAYTDGALPLGFLTFPEQWTLEQIQAVTDQLNQQTAGLADSRQQWHGLPFGVTWTALKPFQWDASFASYLVEYTCGLFGLNAMKLGFMPGRSSGSNALGGSGFADQQDEAADSSEKIPTARWIEGLMNELLDRCLGRPDLEFQFVDLQEQDEKSQLENDQLAVQAGAKSWDQMLQERGEDPVGISEPFIMAPGGQIYSVGDIKRIQEGSPRNPAPGMPIDETDDDEGDGGAPAIAPLKPSPPQLPPGTPGDGTEATGGEQTPPHLSDLSQGRLPATPPAEKFDLASGMQPHGLAGDRAAELRRWKRKAVKDARAGKTPRPFESVILPDGLKAVIADRLARADDMYAVRMIFDRQLDRLEKAAAHPMGEDGLEWAHYAPAASPARSCATCAFITGTGDCSMFQWPVEADYTCDEWSNHRFLTLDEAKAAAAKPVSVAGLCVRAADTGRILMLQRSIADEDDPAAGTWEFPGGHLEDDEDPKGGAIREWQEETGLKLPPGETAGSFVSGGIYECFIHVIPSEQDIQLHLGADDRPVTNPDDPDGDDIETLAWWAPSDAAENPALRPECAEGTDWDMIGQAVPGARFKVAAGDLLKADPQDGDTDRERKIKILAAAAAAAVAMKARSEYRLDADIQQLTDRFVTELARHYKQAMIMGSSDAADQFLISQLSQAELNRLALDRANRVRPYIGNLVDRVHEGSLDQAATARSINSFARGVKAAYEEAFAHTVTRAAPEATCVWQADSDPCEMCGPRDGETYTMETLPGFPGDGDYGSELCLGGPNCQCELDWTLPDATGDDS